MFVIYHKETCRVIRFHDRDQMTGYRERVFIASKAAQKFHPGAENRIEEVSHDIDRDVVIVSSSGILKGGKITREGDDSRSVLEKYGWVFIDNCVHEFEGGGR